MTVSLRCLFRCYDDQKIMSHFVKEIWTNLSYTLPPHPLSPCPISSLVYYGVRGYRQNAKLQKKWLKKKIKCFFLSIEFCLVGHLHSLAYTWKQEEENVKLKCTLCWIWNSQKLVQSMYKTRNVKKNIVCKVDLYLR